MRGWLRHIAIVIAAMSSLSATAFMERNDTVCFYLTWEQMFNLDPDTMIVNPMIDASSPYEVYIETGERKFDKKIRMDYIAASIGDDVWLMNSEYLKKAFKCRRNNIQSYVPLVFNDKTAYVISRVIEENPGYSFTFIREIYYYLDFVSCRVKKITPDALDKLLEDYGDLQKRYESMQDTKDRKVVENFFLMYIERANEDLSRPDILDILGNAD